MSLPANPNDALLSSTVFFCGIVLNTTDYSASWATPTGVSIEATEIGVAVSAESNKYRIVNGNLGIGNFPQGSTFSIMRLLYSDTGNYTCSITFTDTDITERALFQLSLNGMT